MVKLWKKELGNALRLLLPPISFLSFPLLISLPICKAAPWKPARGSGSAVSSPCGCGRRKRCWCILSSKIAPDGNILLQSPQEKNSRIDRKCWNGITAFTKAAERRSGSIKHCLTSPSTHYRSFWTWRWAFPVNHLHCSTDNWTRNNEEIKYRKNTQNNSVSRLLTQSKCNTKTFKRKLV